MSALVFNLSSFLTEQNEWQLLTTLEASIVQSQGAVSIIAAYPASFGSDRFIIIKKQHSISDVVQLPSWCCDDLSLFYLFRILVNFIRTIKGSNIPWSVHPDTSHHQCLHSSLQTALFATVSFSLSGPPSLLSFVNFINSPVLTICLYTLVFLM